MAASLFSGAGGGGGGEAFGLHHCESAPAGLFQDELRQLRKLGLTETLGLVRPLSSSVHLFLLRQPILLH